MLAPAKLGVVVTASMVDLRQETFKPSKNLHRLDG